MKTLLDKNGREIIPGDTLKVFHFIGPRKKRFYMYKYVEAIESRPSWNGKDALLISHLNTEKQTCLKIRDGSTWEECEIVQGYGNFGICFEKRQIHSTPAPRQPNPLIESGKQLTKLT